MPLETTRRLADHLQKRAGEYLRSVIHYDVDDYTIVYMREDVEAQYSEEDIDDVVNQLFSENFFTGKQEELYVHGNLQCTIHCFSHGVEMHFPMLDPQGAAVSLDPQATEELYSFVGDCLTLIKAD